MSETHYRSFRLRIIGYLNIFIIFLGLTKFRIDFVAQRVVCYRLLAAYAICANLAFLAFMPFSYIDEAILISSYGDKGLISLTSSVNLLINFLAAALTIVLRCQREPQHLEFAETLLALDRNFFSYFGNEKAADSYAHNLLYFKVFALLLQTFVPIYDYVAHADELDVMDVVYTFYYCYAQCILVAGLFMYFYSLWLLRARFCLLNMEMKLLLCQLQHKPWKQVTYELAVLGVGMQQGRQWPLRGLLEISNIHARLSSLLVRLNVAYTFLILAVLLGNLLEGISYGYYLTLSIVGGTDWNFYDIQSLLICWYAAVIFVDLNLVYWISHMTLESHEKLLDMLRRFTILPALDVDIEQECEVMVLHLQQQQMNTKIGGMFELNRASALAVWSFVLTNVVVLLQFEFGSRLHANTENQVLNRFNKLFRITGD